MIYEFTYRGQTIMTERPLCAEDKRLLRARIDDTYRIMDAWLEKAADVSGDEPPNALTKLVNP
jgi:hypothetical protein